MSLVDNNDLTAEIEVQINPTVVGVIDSDSSSVVGVIGATVSEPVVTGVKGNAEADYRTGRVNLTPANIGLGNVENEAASTKYVPFRLQSQPQIDTSQAGFRNGMIYVDLNGSGYRMTLEQVKDMNTKIINSENIQSVDFNKLTTDDYIYVQ